MLLVQHNANCLESTFIEFQYIICCWFNVRTDFKDYKLYEFQYIICCWFNESNKWIIINKRVFQYIICCWFNKVEIGIRKQEESFNTLYVVGSTRCKFFNDWLWHLFQYIICCWFNRCFHLHSIFTNLVSIHYMLLVQLVEGHQVSRAY